MCQSEGYRCNKSVVDLRSKYSHEILENCCSVSYGKLIFKVIYAFLSTIPKLKNSTVKLHFDVLSTHTSGEKFVQNAFFNCVCVCVFGVNVQSISRLINHIVELVEITYSDSLLVMVDWKRYRN